MDSGFGTLAISAVSLRTQRDRSSQRTASPPLRDRYALRSQSDLCLDSLEGLNGPRNARAIAIASLLHSEIATLTITVVASDRGSQFEPGILPKLQRSLAQQSRLRSLPRLLLKVNVFLQRRTRSRDRSSAWPCEQMVDLVLWLLHSRSSSSLGFSFPSSGSCDRYNLVSQIFRLASCRLPEGKCFPSTLNRLSRNRSGDCRACWMLDFAIAPLDNRAIRGLRICSASDRRSLSENAARSLFPTHSFSSSA